MMDASIQSIERNIVKEIMRECFPRKVKTNENFVHYLVRLLLVDPNWGIKDHFVTRDKVAKFVNYVIDRLANPSDPKLLILQMQFYFTCNLENIYKVPAKNRREVLDRLYPLKKDIINTCDLSCDDSVELFRKKIVSYMTLVSGLGNPKYEYTYREAEAAFKSVMSVEELQKFTTYSDDQKEEELVQLTNIVSGIRLFNKDCDMGGVGIEELPALLETAITSVRDEMQCGLAVLMEKVNVLTTAADKCYELQQENVASVNEYIMVSTLASDIQHIYMDSIKDMLVFHRQYELYLRQLLQELNNAYTRGEDIHEEFQQMLEQIHSTIYLKIAVPTDQIFPLFEELAAIWTRLQNEVIKLARYSEIAVNLEVYAKNTRYSKELFETFIEVPLTDADRLEQTADIRLTTDNSEITIFSAEESWCIDQVFPFQFLGFCPWKLVETDGALIPGNPAMGVARYKNMNYIFSMPEAFDGFSRNPKEYIRKILDMARKRPYLMNLFSLHEQLDDVKNILQLAEVKVIQTITEHKAIETEDFGEVMPTNIAPKYFWNIWDLKREALLLADLSRRKTICTQTIKTFSTNCMKSQTSEMRSKSQQTMTDNYSNVPKPSNFIYGLRGRKDNEQFIIDLTRPVKE